MTQLTLEFFGPWQAMMAGERLGHFRYDRVRALLTYLAVEADRPHRREALMGLLWPELSQAAARNNLRQVLHALRTALGDREAREPFVLANRTTIQWNPDADCEVDVHAFVALLEACDRHGHRDIESCHDCMRRLEEAVVLFRGPFLADFFVPDSVPFEEWALVKREWLNQLAMDALSRLAAYHERRGRYEQARRFLQQQLGLEPWREQAHRAMMRLHMLEGARGAALAQYEACQELLARELGVEPERATTALYEQIRDASEEAPLELERLGLPAAHRHTLPPPITPFVGREAELAEIGRLMGDEKCRLLTLTGSGGIGKSRLALQAAVEQLETFADGVFFVSLAEAPSAAFLVSTVAAALGLEDGETAGDGLLSWLCERELLLLLDNFEHLLPEGASLVGQIMRQAPGVTLLVTSRERLNVQGEWLFTVGGMSAEADSGLSDGVALFVESAQRAQHDFRLTEGNRDAVARICRLVDGLPLAIELAAAWVQTISCAEIVEQLEQGSAVLRSQWHDAPERHRSVAAVFDHSWQRLTAEEQRALAQLSVFRGGFRQRAAAEVAGASLEILRRLGDRSLLQRDATGRYRLHELLHRYAASKLADGGWTAEAEERHLAFYLALAEEGDSHLQGPQMVRWLERLDAERHNLRAALERGLRQPGKGRVMGLRLAVASWQFWYRRGYLTEGREWLAQALEVVTAEETELYAALHHGAGVLAWNQGDYLAAHEHYEESLALRRQMGDEQGVAALLNNLGNLALDQGQYAQARAYLEESVEIKRRLGHQVGIATSLANLGVVAYEQGDHEAARAFLEKSVLIKRSLGDNSSVAIPLGTLGAIAVEQGDLQAAEGLLQESLALKREAGDRWGVAMTLADLGLLALQRGRFGEARVVMAESLALRRQLDDAWSLAHGLQCVGRLAVMEGRAEEGARLWGAAQALNEEIGVPLAGSERRQYEMMRDMAVAHIGAEAFEREYGMGRVLSLSQALAVAEQICSGDL